RSVTGQPGNLALLLREQWLDAMRGTLADQNHTGPAEHPVYRVELRSACHRVRLVPVPAELAEDVGRRPGLALGLLIRRSLGPAGEQKHRSDSTEQHARQNR